VQYLEAQTDKAVGKIGQTLERTERGIVEVERLRSDFREVAEIGDEVDPRICEALDREVRRLTELIATSHARCFGVWGSLPPLLMLKRIENALEELYKRLRMVRPAFAEAKQRKKDEQRLERQKEEIAEKKAADQRLKYDQALERAQMPIKRRTGRPPVRRMLPIRVKAEDPEKCLAEQIERERIEKLLFD
jgi:hypothetical protein